ncbi:hypothetical protein ES703_112518 [subsurface metagenome]
MAILAGYQPLPAEEVTPDMVDKTEHWCEEHNCAYELKQGRYGPFYAHKTEDPKYPKGWCNENKKKGGTAAQALADDMATAIEEADLAPEPSPDNVSQESSPIEEEINTNPPKQARDPSSLTTLTELFKACNEDFKLQPADVCKELGVNSQNDISDTPAECYLKIVAVR